MPEPPTSDRAFALLRAVTRGRVEISWSCEPDLFVDGIACCDQATARELAHARLIEPAHVGRVGQRVPARLTSLGRDLLASRATAA